MLNNLFRVNYVENKFKILKLTHLMNITFDTYLLNILRCPLTNSSLTYDPLRQELISHQSQLAYPIIDGIPVMLINQARNIN